MRYRAAAGSGLFRPAFLACLVLASNAVAEASSWSVQVAATPDRARADVALSELRASGFAESRVVFEGGVYKARVGSFECYADGLAFKRALRDASWPDAFLVESTSTDAALQASERWSTQQMLLPSGRLRSPAAAQDFLDLAESSLPEALSLAEAAVARAGDSVPRPLLLAKGELLEASSDWRRAQDCYLRVIAGGPETSEAAEARLRLGILYLGRSMEAGGRAELEDILQSTSASVRREHRAQAKCALLNADREPSGNGFRGSFQSAMRLQEQGNTREARRTLEALSTQTAVPWVALEARIRLASLLMDEEPAESTRLLSAVAHTPEHAVDDLRARALMLLSGLAFRAGDKASYEQHLNAVLQLDLNVVPEAASVYLRLANLAVSRGDVEVAGRNYAVAIQGYPHSTAAGECAMRSAYLQLRAGNPSAARELLRQVADGEVASTEAVYEEAVQRFARTCHSMGDRECALNACNILEGWQAKKGRDQTTTRIEIAGLYLELAESGKGTMEDCRRTCRRIMESDAAVKFRAVAELMHSETYARQPEPDFRTAARLSEALIEKFRPLNVENSLTRELAAATTQAGMYHRKGGNPEKAYAFYQRALTEFPDQFEYFAGEHPHANALRGLGHLAEGNGNAALARQLRRDIVELFPESNLARQIRKNNPAILSDAESAHQ